MRNLVREALITQECANPCADAAGAVVIVYNHHERQVAVRLTDRQHRTFHAIVASLHVHIDHDNYMEIIALRGKAVEIRKVDDSLISLKGVRHGRFIKTLANHFP